MCTVCILCILCVLCVSCACCPFAAPGLLWSPGLHVHCSLLRALHMPGGRLPREPVVCARRAAGDFFVLSFGAPHATLLFAHTRLQRDTIHNSIVLARAA